MPSADELLCMSRTIRLKNVESTLEMASYPLSREQAHTEFDDVTFDLADGSVSFTETLDQSQVETFANPEELLHELYSYLPRRAVGEPFQSEGDA